LNDNNQEERMSFVIPEYKPVHYCKANLNYENYSVAPIMLANSAMVLTAILIHLL
jgi:hypothetical protein